MFDFIELFDDDDPLRFVCGMILCVVLLKTCLQLCWLMKRSALKS